MLETPDAVLETPSAPVTRAWPIIFTGSGAGYFHLWITNLLLTVVTLGIYSAWAKTKRLQYFARHTQLAGASFDFRGSPGTVLRGRLIALVMLVVYRVAFGLSALAWIASFLAAVALLPIMIRGAMRFRLANTTYRGIAFDFDGTVAAGYRAFVPVITFFLLPGMVIGLTGSKVIDDWSIVLFLLIPWLHLALIRYRMAHIRYGSLPATITLPARAIWGIYLRTGGVVAVVIVTLLSIETFVLKDWDGNTMQDALFLYVTYLVIIPLFTARLANLAWSNTSFPGVTIQSTLPAAAFLRMQTTNLLWTVLTLGLYRPFGMVRLYRYRMAHLTVHIDGDFEHRAAAVARARPGAIGEGAADLFGIDISL